MQGKSQLAGQLLPVLPLNDDDSLYYFSRVVDRTCGSVSTSAYLSPPILFVALS